MLGILSIFDRIIIVYLESRVNFNHRDRQLGSRLDSRLGYRLFTSKSIESNEFLFSLTFKSTWKTPSCLIVDSLIGNEGKCGRYGHLNLPIMTLYRVDLIETDRQFRSYPQLEKMNFVEEMLLHFYVN